MIRFLVDEDFNNDILRGLRRRLPGVDALRIQALGLARRERRNGARPRRSRESHRADA